MPTQEMSKIPSILLERCLSTKFRVVEPNHWTSAATFATLPDLFSWGIVSVCVLKCHPVKVWGSLTSSTSCLLVGYPVPTVKRIPAHFNFVLKLCHRLNDDVDAPLIIPTTSILFDLFKFQILKIRFFLFYLGSSKCFPLFFCWES